MMSSLKAMSFSSNCGDGNRVSSIVLSDRSLPDGRRLGDLPVLAALVAGVVTWRSWQLDTDLRAEVHVAVSVEWRLFRRPTGRAGSARVIVIGMVVGVGIVIHGIAG